MAVHVEEAREIVRKRLEAQRAFLPHLLAYVIVNTGLILLWATVAGQGFFWPGFVLGGWGIGVVMHGAFAFLMRPVTQGDVDREMQRLGYTTPPR